MLEKKCTECGSLFRPRQKNSKFCGSKCAHANWRANNREYYNETMREWRQKNPQALADYNAKRKRTSPTISCKVCGKEFQRRSGPNIYCSIPCRNKTKKRPDKTQRNVYAKEWREKNRKRLNDYHKKHYPGYALRKMTKNPWSSLLTSAKQRALKFNINFDLTQEWASKRWTGRCELTNLQFSAPSKRVGYKNRNFSPSIDRINPKDGYTQQNCRIVLWAVNSLKRDGTDQDMYLVATSLIARGTNAEALLSLPA